MTISAEDFYHAGGDQMNRRQILYFLAGLPLVGMLLPQPPRQWLIMLRAFKSGTSQPEEPFLVEQAPGGSLRVFRGDIELMECRTYEDPRGAYSVFEGPQEACHLRLNGDKLHVESVILRYSVDTLKDRQMTPGDDLK